MAVGGGRGEGSLQLSSQVCPLWCVYSGAAVERQSGLEVSGGSFLSSHRRSSHLAPGAGNCVSLACGNNKNIRRNWEMVKTRVFCYNYTVDLLSFFDD